MNFSVRAMGPELLDQPDIPAADIQQNLRELSVINRFLGGHAITKTGYARLATHRERITVCEIGCGGGDNLKALETVFGKSPATLSLIGIDINPDCIRVAEALSWQSRVQFLIRDYKEVWFEQKPDILFSSLFCHHFTGPELVDMFRWMKQNCTAGFFINDLHRHRLAYYSIRWLTHFFSRSYLVKNDAPLSVLRGFKKKELINLLRQAGITHYSIQWKWAFRWLIVANL